MKLECYDVVNDAHYPLPTQTVRVRGEGWYIEILPLEDGVYIRCNGDFEHDNTIMVVPHMSNTVAITTKSFANESRK